MAGAERTHDRHDLAFDGIDRRATFIDLGVARVDHDDELALARDARLLLPVAADFGKGVDLDEKPCARRDRDPLQVEGQLSDVAVTAHAVPLCGLDSRSSGWNGAII